MGLQAAEKLAASVGQSHQEDIAALKQQLGAAAQAADHQKLVVVSIPCSMPRSGLLLSIAAILQKVCKLWIAPCYAAVA